MERHLAGATTPETPSLLIQGAEIVALKGRPEIAVNWFRAGMDASPSLVDDPTNGHRARAILAALAAATTNAESKDAYRAQALEWLEAEVAALESEAERRDPPRDWLLSTLAQWYLDPILATVRSPALEELSETERRRWEVLWNRLGALLEKGK
jgi:hypothetical protein